MKRFFLLASLATAAVGLGACGGEPTFTPKTTAPPGAVADFFESSQSEGRTIRLTEGVALAIECTDKKGHPCSFDGTTILDANVASVLRAYGDINQKLVVGSAGQSSYQTRTLFVVMAKKVGTTTLTVRTGYGDVPISVEVVPAKS